MANRKNDLSAFWPSKEKGCARGELRPMGLHRVAALHMTYKHPSGVGFKCRTHPTYLGQAFPWSGCGTCRMIFDISVLANSKPEYVRLAVIPEPTDADLAWLENTMHEGAAPALVNDDNGHWAVAFDGMQSVPSGSKPQTVSTSFFIDADLWRNTIHEAIAKAKEDWDGDEIDGDG